MERRRRCEAVLKDGNRCTRAWSNQGKALCKQHTKMWVLGKFFKRQQTKHYVGGK